METRTFKITFNTPAFLGDAAQNGRWRTPPFKHLLREWWRVAWAMDNDPAGWRRMREVEGRLLGHAWLENDRDQKGAKASGRRSLVRMRLSDWKTGTMRAMPATRPAAPRAPASGLYLGYGPVAAATRLKMQHPVDTKEQGEWLLCWPKEAEGARYLETALSLIHQYGALGGRSRNGWGSVVLEPNEAISDDRLFRPWEDCLQQDWAHAIGHDSKGPLVWRLPSRMAWTQVVEDLAAVRKQVNQLAKTNGGRPLVNQPVGGKGERVPSNLRFKVRRDEQGLYGVVFHMPFSPPPLNGKNARPVWEKVHAFLDHLSELERSAS